MTDQSAPAGNWTSDLLITSPTHNQLSYFVPLTYDHIRRHDRFSHDVIARGGISSYRDVILVPYSAYRDRRLLPDLRSSKRYLNTI